MARERSNVHVWLCMVAIMRACVKLPARLYQRGVAMKKLLAHVVVRRHRRGRPHSPLSRARVKRPGSSKPRACSKSCARSATPLIPDRLMARAYGIAVIPNVVKVALGVGGRRGSGAMVVRDANGRFSTPSWSPSPAAMSAGRSACSPPTSCWCSPRRKSIEGITDGKLTLGGDASVAAGPVGRSASAATDQNFTAEVYSYSRNRGLFAGVSIDGSVIAIDTKSNTKLYGKTAPATDIIAGHITTDADAAKRFERAIRRARRARAPAAAPHSVGDHHRRYSDAAPRRPRRRPRAPPTFPMEDAQPGAEPPQLRRDRIDSNSTRGAVRR